MFDLVSQFFIEPFAHDFMQRALLASVMIGAICSLFSCFLILRGWSLMGDAVSHAVLPGLAIAWIVGLPLAVGAFIAGMLCAVSTGYIRSHSRVKEDAVMAIVFSGMFALGLVMLTKIETDVHLLHILFGNVLGLSSLDVIEVTSISSFAALVLLIKRRDFTLCCFDPAHAAAIGLPVRLLDVILLAVLSMTIVAALKAAGIILVVAMLITPGATAYLLSRSMGNMMLISAVISVLSCVFGTVISYHLDCATAPLIVVIQALVFVCALAVSRRPRIAKGENHAPA